MNRGGSLLIYIIYFKRFIKIIIIIKDVRVGGADGVGVKMHWLVLAFKSPPPAGGVASEGAPEGPPDVGDVSL